MQIVYSGRADGDTIRTKHKLGPKHGTWVLNGPKALVTKLSSPPRGRPEIFRVKFQRLLPTLA